MNWSIARRRPVQNRVVARRMTDFFKDLGADDRRDPVLVAEKYGRSLWSPFRHTLLDEKKLSRSRFYVGITADGGRPGFEHLTRRATLISDTLLLTHGWNGDYHDLGIRYRLPLTKPAPRPRPAFGDWKDAVGAHYTDSLAREEEMNVNNRTLAYGMHCPDLADLGQWIMDAEPLLTAGLAWYLPSYRGADQCSGLWAGGEGPRWEGRQGPSSALAGTVLLLDVLHS